MQLLELSEDVCPTTSESFSGLAVQDLCMTKGLVI